MNATLSVDLYLIITIATFSIGLFFIVYLLSSSFLQNLSNRILIYIVALFLCYIGYNYLVHAQLIYYFPWIFKFVRFFDLLIYLLFFFYFIALDRKEGFKTRVVHWSLLGGLSMIIFLTNPAYLFSPLADQHQLLDKFYSDTRPGPTSIWRNWKFLLLKFILPISLLTAASIHFFKNTFTRFSNRLTRNLLSASLILLLLFVLFRDWIFSMLYHLSGRSFIEWPVELFVLSVVQLILVFYAIKLKDIAPFIVKYASSALSKEEAMSYLRKVQTLMNEEKVYLNPKVSLSSLASQLNINNAYLSQAINAELGIRFSDFLNSYRIEEAKRLLKDSTYHKYTIEGIAKEVGFTSSSSFYKAFRKQVGMSPNAYKKTEQQ